MPRCGRLRSFIREYKESGRLEKWSFIPPFAILALEIILIAHAFMLQEIFVILLTLILVIISSIEIILVSTEIHEHYKCLNFDRVLTIRLDDFITETKEINVKKIVKDFIELHPEYKANRNEIYHTTCQILETHREEAFEKEISNKLTKYIRRKKKANVDEIVESFIKRYPKYNKYRMEIYEKSCQIMANLNKK